MKKQMSIRFLTAGTFLLVLLCLLCLLCLTAYVQHNRSLQERDRMEHIAIFRCFRGALAEWQGRLSGVPLRTQTSVM